VASSAPTGTDAQSGACRSLRRAVPIDPGDPSGQPSFLEGAVARGGGDGAQAGAGDLLTARFVAVDQAFQLGPSLRDAAGAVDPLANLADEQVVLIELEEGGTAVGTVADLRGEPGRGVEGIVGRLFALRFSDDDLIQGVRAELTRRLRERFGKKVTQAADQGLSWLGTKLLLEAIEARLPVATGLYRWDGGDIRQEHHVAVDDAALLAAAPRGVLVFLHGTGSCTRGSFGHLASTATSTWEVLQSHFQGHLYGFEHATFSQSPIENALQLAQALPQGTHLHLVSHSRGGLVADLLCLASIDDELIEQFCYPGHEPGPLGEQQRAAEQEQQRQLRELRSLLAQKQFHIERYVRVACPARGTRLLGSHLDLFLSGLLSLVGMVPLLAGHAVYGVLKRVVLEIVKRRTHPALVPGLAAMLPDSPFGALLAQAPLREGLAMATIAGSSEGANPLQKLALLLGDALFFERCANDLVVDTASMQAGIAPRAGARTLREQARGVNHFRYFQRASSSRALGRWLSEAKPDSLGEFLPLATAWAERERQSTRQSDQEERRRAPRQRGGSGGSPQPVVVVIPDLLASHLWEPRQQKRLWFDPGDRSLAALPQVGDIHSLEIEAEKVNDLIYGDLCRELLASHRVERFAYDWRQPLELSAQRLDARLRELLTDPDLGEQPVRLLAHGMGGLVVRGLIARAPELWQQLIQRDGARVLLLGTPNHGSFHMVATLIGHSPLIRRLARVDPDGDLQGQLDAMAAFPGALQWLPQPGWAEEESGAPLPFQAVSWFDPALWTQLQACNRDPSFGDGHGATPTQDALEKGAWLWNQNQTALPALPGVDPGTVILVNGKAPITPCALDLENGHPRLLGTPDGDGLVTWRSAALGNVGKTYLMEADHGGLTCRREFFPALLELLNQGTTTLLPEMPTSTQGRRRPIAPEPVPWPSDEELLRGLVGGQTPPAADQPAIASLRVSCHAMDLRFIQCPLMVGHYEQDPIAAAEAMIDQHIVAGELSSRERLGVYAGPVGTATVVLMNRDQEELHAGRCRGAVVIGLGKLGDLSAPSLMEAVQGGTLRYLLQILDRHGSNRVGAVNVELASLLIGQNSSHAISIDDSISALVMGVLEANREFARVFPQLSVRVGSLKIVEVFLDTAISATRSLRALRGVGKTDDGVQLEVDQRLHLGTGWRHRLDANQAAGYWPRMLVLGEGASGTGKLADRLQYSFLGERARAERVLQELQGDLVEELVANSIQQSAYNQDLSRTLFQLLVPTPFKDFARRLDQLVLVLDERTANLPWELLMADDKPIALQLAMVRQLQASTYRQRVRQSPSRHAYVIGNPATTNFHRVFAGSPSGENSGLASLNGAREEANAVVQLLSEHGYDVEPSIEDLEGVDVINKLYRRSYRILHIAAHGVFEQLTHSGECRTGVVLANGMLITVSEIESMEVVPDLVVLNCCHLGTIKTAIPTPFNRLAASVASRLIAIGVRAVVACGWAVNDQAALIFSQTLYGAMLANKPFGDAVFAARQAAYALAPDSNTWGAYQAYGDPTFLLEDPQDAALATPGTAPPNEESWVTPHELVARLRQLLVSAEETTQRRPADDLWLSAQLSRLRESAPAAWWRESSVAFALAEATAALGQAHREEARGHYLEAIRLHRGDDALPVRVIEQLACLEAQLGETTGERRWLDSALARLEALKALLAPASEAAPPPGHWFTLKGSVQLRLAGLVAREIVEGRTSVAAGRLREALEASIETLARAGADPQAQIHRLTLQALQRLAAPTRKRPKPAEASASRDLTTLQEELQSAFQQERSFARGLLATGARLALGLQEGSLATAGARGQRTANTLLNAYRSVFLTCPASPLQRDCAVEELMVLERLLRALDLSLPGSSEAAVNAANQLARLIKALQEEVRSAADGEEEAADEDGELVVVVE
jgi:CHAT domain-containing protein